ncbi:MAG: hypothetical protein AAF328_03575 [Planctomycetota bacterium]
MRHSYGVERRAIGVRAGAAVALLSVVGLTPAVASTDGASFQIMPYSGVFSFLSGVSADGQIAAGGSGGFRDYDPIWGEKGDVFARPIPRFPANVSSDALGISGDGNVVIGRSGLTGSSIRATRWVRQGDGSWAGEFLNDENGDPTGDLFGGSTSGQPWAASQDGSVIVGGSRSDNGNEAFRWTEATGMVGLGDLPGGSFISDAKGVSRDGTVVVGFSQSDNGTEAFRWTAASGMVGLGDFPGGITASQSEGVSGDGQTVVGSAGVPFDAETGWTSGRVAAKWTQADGWVDLGNFSEADGGDPSQFRNGLATGASYDGSVIVGTSGLATRSSIPFVWSEASGMRPVKAVLLEAGVTDVDGWDILGIRGISDDGRTLVGDAMAAGNAFSGFFATLPEAFITGGIGVGLTGDFTGNGQVEQGDLNLVLNNWGGARGAWENTEGFATGNVDQEELNAVLNNWGASGSPSFEGFAVPEPATGLVVLGLLGLGRPRRRAARR